MKNIKSQIKNQKLPAAPGVYLMMDRQNKIIYIGKAGSLKARVSSYFTGAKNNKTTALVSNIAKIDYQTTDTVLEATFLESKLIKKHKPKYNLQQKDDKSYVYIVVTKDQFPKVVLKRGREIKKDDFKVVFGPFQNAQITREILKTVRPIFPWSRCKRKGTLLKPCFDYQLGKCPGVCIDKISKNDYNKIIRNLILFFKGKRKSVINNIKKQMQELAKKQEFEKAAKIRNQLYQLEHIADVKFISKVQNPFERVLNLFKRIEGYDISNISGKYAVGGMVVFENGKPKKQDYRKFCIKTVKGANDVAMVSEILRRRFNHSEWPMPNLILIDGGIAQVCAVVEILRAAQDDILVVGIAKGRTRKNTRLVYGKMTQSQKLSIKNQKNILIQVRNEAHRFALQYHKKLRLKF